MVLIGGRGATRDDACCVIFRRGEGWGGGVLGLLISVRKFSTAVHHAHTGILFETARRRCSHQRHRELEGILNVF